MNTTKIALFDVDKTLIHGDSMFYLLKYTIKEKTLFIHSFTYIIYKIIRI